MSNFTIQMLFYAKELHPNRQLLFYYNCLYLSFLECGDLTEEVLLLDWIHLLWRRRCCFSPTSKQKRSLQPVVPESLVTFPALGGMTWNHFQEEPFASCVSSSPCLGDSSLLIPCRSWDRHAPNPPPVTSGSGAVGASAPPCNRPTVPWRLQSLLLVWHVFFAEWLRGSSRARGEIALAIRRPAGLPVVEAGDSCLVTHAIFMGQMCLVISGSSFFFKYKNRLRWPSHLVTQRDFYPRHQGSVIDTGISVACQHGGVGGGGGRALFECLATSLLSAEWQSQMKEMFSLTRIVLFPFRS